MSPSVLLSSRRGRLPSRPRKLLTLRGESTVESDPAASVVAAACAGAESERGESMPLKALMVFWSATSALPFQSALLPVALAIASSYPSNLQQPCY